MKNFATNCTFFFEGRWEERNALQFFFSKGDGRNGTLANFLLRRAMGGTERSPIFFRRAMGGTERSPIFFSKGDGRNGALFNFFFAGGGVVQTLQSGVQNRRKRAQNTFWSDLGRFLGPPC